MRRKNYRALYSGIRGYNRNMRTLIHERVDAATEGTNPTAICRVPSGWVVLGDSQHLRGYCLLLSDPVVPDLNALTGAARARFLMDMTLVGDALLEITGAARMNYEILGNLDPALHAHIFPRYANEPDAYRTMPPMFYPAEIREATPFDRDRDFPLMEQIAAAIQRSIGDADY